MAAVTRIVSAVKGEGMADIKNKNELKRRIELVMDELDYSINEEFCKETMLMMREFIGRASHLLDCADAKIKKAKRTARKKAIDEMQGNLIRNSRTEVIDGEICLVVTDKRIKQIAEQMKGEL